MSEAPAAPAAPSQAAFPSAPSNPSSTAPSEATHGSFLSQELRAAAAAGPKGQTKPAEPPQEQPRKPAAPTQQKPQAPKPQEQPKKSDATAKTEEKPQTPASDDDWQVEALPADEPEQQEEAQPEEALANMKPEAQTRWKDLRAKEEKLKQIEPEYTQMKEELAKLRATPEKLPEAVENELNELRQFKAGYDITSTEEFQQAVVQPFNAEMAKVHEVADFAGIPLKDFSEVLAITNGLARTRAVRELFEKRTDGPEISPEEVSIVTRAFDEIHAKVYPKQAELQAKALEIQNGFRGQQEVQSAKQREAMEKALGDASGEHYNVLEAKMAPLKLFEDQEFAARVKAARPADPVKEPMLAISQAQARATLPKVMTYLNGIIKENGELKKALKARGESSASTTDTPASRAAAEAQKDRPDEGSSIVDEIRGYRQSNSRS